VAADDRRLTIQAAQALVLTAAVRVFFSTAWVNTHISQYLLHMLITICLLHVMARVPWWIGRPALAPFGPVGAKTALTTSELQFGEPGGEPAPTDTGRQGAV